MRNHFNAFPDRPAFTSENSISRVESSFSKFEVKSIPKSLSSSELKLDFHEVRMKSNNQI